jgi:hypothetical protein
MIININSSRTNLFQNITVNKTNNNSNEKADKSNSSINLKQKNKQSSLMENLLKQKQSFTEEKQTLAANSDMDAKEKKSKLEEVDKKIQEIDAQIQQLNIQEKQEELEKQKDKISEKKNTEESNNKNGDEIRDGVIISASLNELIKLSSSKETMHLLKDSKNRQKIEAEYIKPNDNPNSYNNKRLSQISKSIASIDMTVSRKIGELNKSAEKIKDKTESAIKQIKNKEDIKSDKDNKTNEDTKANDDNKNIKEPKES